MGKTSAKPAWIVIAEDNRPDVFLIQEALNQEGVWYCMDTIEDGDEMLKFIDRLDGQARRPDLLLIDLNLPKRSGSEVLARLRASVAAAAIPVIVMSSSDNPRDRERAEALGAKLYFRKPAQLDEFLKVGGHIRRVLAQAAVGTTPE